MALFFEMSGAPGDADAGGAAERRATGIEQLQARIREGERRIDALALANQAMWELLRERLGVEDAELMNRIHEIDLRDGVKDGKMRPALVPCPTCHRRTQSTRPLCMYCGATIERDFF